MDPFVEDFMKTFSAGYIRAGRPEPTIKDLILEYKTMNARLTRYREREEEFLATIRAYEEKMALMKPRAKPRQKVDIGSSRQEKLREKIAEEEANIANDKIRMRESNDLEYIKSLKKSIDNAKARKRNAEKALKEMTKDGPMVADLKTCVMCDNIASFSTDLYYCSPNCMNEHCSK
jgi:predicted phage-related endonuclease